MGISGLLPALKGCQRSQKLSNLSGQTLAVDAYVWLHKGIHTCATELAKGQPTIEYVKYAMRRIETLQKFKISPYVVFDGGRLPAKSGTENTRQQSRLANLAKADAFSASGNATKAREYYAKCVDVTPQMAYQFIKALRARNIQYVVAPYEADAQMRYLEMHNLVDGVITEDSDLLVYGCENVHFKLDRDNEEVVSFSRSQLHHVNDGKFNFSGWTEEQFRHMAVLSGCDYLPSIPGIGLQTAHTWIKKHKKGKQAIRAIRWEGKKSVPTGYEAAFELANKVFLHQRVYCPKEERLVPLTPIDDECEMTEELNTYIGRDLPSATAKGIALGDIDPVTLLPMKDINEKHRPGSTPLSKNGGNIPRKGHAAKVTALSRWLDSKPKASTSKLSPRKPKVGRMSGAKTLSGLIEEDKKVARSQYFKPVEGSTKHTAIEIEEDIVVFADHADDDKENIGSLSDCEIVSDFDPVQQDDGYITPPSTLSQNEQDFSSPAKPDTPSKKSKSKRKIEDAEEDDYDAEVMTSPAGPCKPSVPRDGWNLQAILQIPEEQDEIEVVDSLPTPPSSGGDRTLEEDIEEIFETDESRILKQQNIVKEGWRQKFMFSGSSARVFVKGSDVKSPKKKDTVARRISTTQSDIDLLLQEAPSRLAKYKRARISI